MALTFGNGIIVELRATGDSEEVLEVLRGAALGTGHCRPVMLSEDERARLWLHRDGDECYVQGNENPGYVFINPRPTPALVD